MAYTITTNLLIFLCLISISKAVRNLNSINNQDESSSLLVDQVGICSLLIETQGYTCEEHKVTTEDGYILNMQHIPKSHDGTKADKPPVLLQHGLLMVDGGSWVLNAPDESLGFVLADNGFDVWIANTRGTNYSRGHTSLSPSDPAYWEWSWDELATYDLPASIQFVRNQTGQNLHYVGHSLGTLIAFSAFSKGQTLNMLRSAVLLSPIAYLGQVSSSFARVGADFFLGEGSSCWSSKRYMQDSRRPNCCMNSSMTGKFLEHEPHSTSTKNMIHLAQSNLAFYKLIQHYNLGC
ncbi:putative triacylglycerol lipase [Helianthus annuus]|uniref:Triacylglycerol lipase n=1 Tax=Helianthus annuus TaxID=4232 RepID=A0A9K3NV94_HELAN|nr:putative triacylglycerol lipase [Helianthus annuus]